MLCGALPLVCKEHRYRLTRVETPLLCRDLENLDLVDANIGDIKACLLDLSNNGEEVVEM